MGTNDIVETYPDGSTLEARIPVVSLNEDGSYNILDVNGSTVTVRHQGDTQAWVHLALTPPPEPPPILPPTGD